ncbi:hypothetical protein [Nitrospira sp. BLG_2]|uniref:hypothetical protein n=1 Tax=Nitrospira sp. BLG_2 TaxID=3397507 RepID=UPI003B9BBE6A
MPKLTPYQLAGLWSEIDDCGYRLRNLNYKNQDSKEFYKLMDRLRGLEDKMKVHEESNEPER